MREHHAQARAEGHTESGQPVEVLKYALQMHGIDYRNLVARNQFVKHVINPLMDSVDKALKLDHVVGSETRYKVSLLIESERDVEMQ